MIKKLFLFSVLLAISCWSYANNDDAAAITADASDKAATMPAVDPISTSNPLTVLLGLLFVLAVIFALAWLVKQYNNSGLMGNRAMKIVASLPLGTRERAVLIEIGEKQILVGVAPGSVNALHVFDEKVLESGGQPEHAFASKLNKLLKNKPADKTIDVPESDR